MTGPASTWLTRSQAASALGMHPNTFDRWFATDAASPLREPRNLLIVRSRPESAGRRRYRRTAVERVAMEVMR